MNLLNQWIRLIHKTAQAVIKSAAIDRRIELEILMTGRIVVIVDGTEITITTNALRKIGINVTRIEIVRSEGVEAALDLLNVTEAEMIVMISIEVIETENAHEELNLTEKENDTFNV